MRFLSIGLLTCVFAVASCGQSGESLLGDYRAIVANSLSEDISLIHDDYSVTKSAVTVGSAPNQIIIRGSEAIVISSLSNSIQVIDIKTWTVVREYSVGDGCNPYMMALTQADLLVITCNQSNELILVDPDVPLEAEAVLKRMDMPAGDDMFPFEPTNPGLARPQGVVVVGHRAYVTLTNLDANWAPAGPGLVLVVDVAAWTQDKLIQLSKTNPASIYKAGSGGEKIYATCPGPYPFDGTGIVDVITTSNGAVEATIEIGGAPGRMWIDSDGSAWVGDMNGGNILGFDTASGQVVDPISLCPTPGDYLSDLATDGSGNIFACCFGTDAVHAFPVGSPADAKVMEVGDGPVAILVIQR